MKLKYLVVLLLALTLLAGCGNDQTTINSIDDMKDKELIIGLPDDIDDATEYVLELCPGAKIEYQNDVILGVNSVAEGKSDAYVAGFEYLYAAVEGGKVDNVRILDEPIHVYQCALGLSSLCAIPDYENTVNSTIERMIADGTMAEMRDRWFNRGVEELPEIKLDDDPEYVLHAVTFGQVKPYSFIKDGALVGFDVELIYRICAENHWGVKLEHADYPGMVMGLSTGKYDMVSANLYITENREANVIFSVPFNEDEIGVCVRADTAAAAGAAPKLEYGDLAALESADSFAVMTGTIFDSIIHEKYPSAEVQYYPTPVDGALALANGRVDAVVHDAPSLKYIAACTDGVALLPEYIAKDDYYFLMPKTSHGEELRQEFNEWLAEQKQSGEIQRIYDFWCSDEDPDSPIPFDELPAINGSINIAADTVGRPDSFLFNNGLTGFPSELIYNFCRDKGYAAEISIITFDALIPALASGKADIVIGLVSYTDERAQSVLFTDSVLEGGIGVLVRATEEDTGGAFLEEFKDGLKKTFVTESRWKLIASGLGVTFLITIGGFLLANLLGAAFCACNMSRRRGLRMLAGAYDRIMQGTPVVVILMIFYYVIFGSTNVSGIWVAIIAFGMVSGASLAQQFHGSITGVPKGQTEAALAIGFTKFEAFRGVVLPQAARAALPGYFSEIINLMKGTAIVGYIAVTDLTKASDLIRSSTYDAFFPLLSVAVIYFLIAFGILSLLKHFRKKLAPKRVGSKEAAK